MGILDKRLWPWIALATIGGILTFGEGRLTKYAGVAAVFWAGLQGGSITTAARLAPAITGTPAGGSLGNYVWR